MTPQEYEHYCAALLRESRWAARVTRASGDQGVDIVAEKRGARIVVQCKKYRKPVGNRAVQEIVAAIAHEDAQRGWSWRRTATRERRSAWPPPTGYCCYTTRSYTG
ncbi:restriction endonuclease [Methylocystis sp. IM2]